MTFGWPWILLIGLFLGMHLFRLGLCCGGHGNHTKHDGLTADERRESDKRRGCH